MAVDFPSPLAGPTAIFIYWKAILGPEYARRFKLIKNNL